MARELVRIYLTTYRLTQAAEVVERCRALMPADPQPYLWSIEIGPDRCDARRHDPELPGALERDPELDKARLGLAEQLTKDRRFDEAEVGIPRLPPSQSSRRRGDGGPGPQRPPGGDIEGAARDFESALGG